jgi:hypothetical protein
METLENHQLQQPKNHITIFGYHLLQQPNKLQQEEIAEKMYKQ